MTSDAELTAAFQEEIAEDAIIQEDVAGEIVEEVEETIEEVEPDELLPKDHKERSDMGRKLAAFLKKTDKMEEVLAQQAELIGRLLPKQEEDEEYDEPVTRKELNALLNKQKVESTQYETDFKKTFHTLCDANSLSEEESDAIGKILLEKYNNQIVGDGKLDGALNFEKARADFFKEKPVPLRQGKPPGVIKNQGQQKVVQKEKKLDSISESYRQMMERMNGKEYTQKVLSRI